jgi:hypothetical protein
MKKNSTAREWAESHIVVTGRTAEQNEASRAALVAKLEADEDSRDQAAAEALALIHSVRQEVAAAHGTPIFVLWPEAVMSGIAARRHELTPAGQEELAGYVARGVFRAPTTVGGRS